MRLLTKGPFCIFLLLFFELLKGDITLPHTSSSAMRNGTPPGRIRLEDKEFNHIPLENTLKWNGLWEQNTKDEETSCRSDHFLHLRVNLDMVTSTPLLSVKTDPHHGN